MRDAGGSRYGGAAREGIRESSYNEGEAGCPAPCHSPAQRGGSGGSRRDDARRFGTRFDHLLSNEDLRLLVVRPGEHRSVAAGGDLDSHAVGGAFALIIVAKTAPQPV